jgi:predicted acylesterase/phospholipase RssA
MRVLVLPVSGGRFPVQLVFLRKLIEYKYRPDLILATSGGNICSYIALASNFDLRSFQVLIEAIDSEFLIKERSSFGILSRLIGFFKGSLYLASEKTLEFLKKIFLEIKDPKEIKNFEIWSGVYNIKKQKSQFFCNRNREESILSSLFPSNFTKIYPVLDPKYLDGDLERISKTIISSAALPGYIEKQEIDEQEYLDGGVSCASPLTYLFDLLEENFKELEIVYLNSLDNHKENNVFTKSNIIENWKQAADDLMRSMIAIDKSQALRMFKKKSKLVIKEFSHQELPEALKLSSSQERSFLEIYPLAYKELQIGKFSNEEIIESIKKTEENFMIRMIFQDCNA